MRLVEAFIPLPEACMTGTFIKRIKRFQVDIEVGGTEISVHCNNSGSMLGLLRHGASVLVSPAAREGRKLLWTMERTWISNGRSGFWVGVNTLLPNKMLASAFKSGVLSFAEGCENLKMETKRGQSRLDACLTSSCKPPLWIECKNVTLVEDNIAAFPDAVSERAKKHLLELMSIVKDGERGAMFFLVQRPDAKCFQPADYIDPAYASLFYEALKLGVEAYAYEGIQRPGGVQLGEPLQILKF